jgi:hypothetical protein
MLVVVQGSVLEIKRSLGRLRQRWPSSVVAVRPSRSAPIVMRLLLCCDTTCCRDLPPSSVAARLPPLLRSCPYPPASNGHIPLSQRRPLLSSGLSTGGWNEHENGRETSNPATLDVYLAALVVRVGIVFTLLCVGRWMGNGGWMRGSSYNMTCFTESPSANLSVAFSFLHLRIEKSAVLLCFSSSCLARSLKHP